MFLLALCILVNVLIAVCFKLFSRQGVQGFVAIVFNYVVCVVLGSIFVGYVPILKHDLATGWVPFGIALGCCFIVGFNFVALSIKHTGITVTTVMQKMSLLLSSGYAILFFFETTGVTKITGIALSVIAIVLINLGRRDRSKSLSRDPNLVFPFLALVFSGAIEAILFHIHAKGLSVDQDAILVTYSFSVAGIFGVLIIPVLYATGRIRFQWRDYIWGLALGLPNFFSIYLILVLLKHGFEGSVLFPVLNVGVLVASTIVAILIFRETLNRWNFVGIGLAILSIIMIMTL